jgi:putative oxidoreductase
VTNNSIDHLIYVRTLTAMFTVHLPYGFSSIKIKAIVDGRAQFGPPGYECDLL